jgi:dihydroxy-acid dehydratase
MLRAVGFTDADFARPQVGIASTWAGHALQYAHRRAGPRGRRRRQRRRRQGVIFNTITVSDGISMGTPGMRYSLVSREVIADSIETVVAGEGFDGFVAIGGCDKNMPGCVMAMARLDRPVGVRLRRHHPPRPGRRDIISVFEAVGGHARGTVSPTPSWPRSSARPFPGPGPAAACTPPTPWPRRSRRSA